jgi:hypothetical protein
LNAAPVPTIKKPTRPKAPRIGRPGYVAANVSEYQ